MPIVVCGMNHKTASVALREKVIFAMDKLALYLNDLLADDSQREAVILSTCNRSEIYCDTDDLERLIAWFCRQHGLSYHDIKSSLFVYQDQQAIQHIMRVACGLDSMIVGEPQILGQMKEAFSESCAAGAVGPLFQRLFQQVFALAKEVRTHTAIGACPVSVASTAVKLASQLCPTWHAATVLVIGSGDTANLVLRHLTARSVTRLLIANRQRDNAVKLAQQYQGEALSLDDLPHAFTLADVVISATGSTLPVVTPAMLPQARSDMLIIDIAMPRDVDPAVGELSFVKLFCIDDLRTMTQHNQRGREHAAEKASEVILQKAHDFMAWMRSYDAVATTIRAYREQIEGICQMELNKAIRQLKRGDDPIQVLTHFSQAFINKLLHTPSVQLRQAGISGRIELLELAKELFAIPQTKTETL